MSERSSRNRKQQRSVAECCKKGLCGISNEKKHGFVLIHTHTYIICMKIYIGNNYATSML